MTTIQSENLSQHAGEAAHTDGHGDYRLFGLATFLVADGMTFAGFFAAYLTFRAVNPLPSGHNYELELLLLLQLQLLPHLHLWLHWPVEIVHKSSVRVKKQCSEDLHKPYQMLLYHHCQEGL